MPAASSPTGNEGNDDLGHEPDEPLNFEDVKASAAGCINRVACFSVRVLVAVGSANSLIAARTKSPTAVFRAGAVPGQQHDTDRGIDSNMVEHVRELVDGVRAEGVANLGSVKCDARHTTVCRKVIRDVAEVFEPRHV